MIMHAFSTHKLPEKMIMEMMYVYEKTNTNLMRPHAGSGYLNGSYQDMLPAP